MQGILHTDGGNLPFRTGLCTAAAIQAGAARDHVKYKIAGINHMAWLLEITRNGEDYYPQIKQRAEEGPILKPYTREMLKDYPQLLYPEYDFTPDRHG